jgi:hypothetical protein
MSSSQRSSNSNSATDVFYNLSQIVALKSAKGMFQIVVHGITVPFSFYQMSSDINTLLCTFVDTSLNSKTATVTIPVGNYTTVSVLTALSAALTTICKTSIGSFVGYTPVFNFSYNQITCKTTLAMTSPSLNAYITIPFQNNINLGGFFGMSTSVTISTVSTPISSSISVANPVSYLLLRSGNLKQFQNREFVVQKDAFSDILYKIPLATQSGTWISYRSDSDPVFIVNNNISSFNFYLTSNLTYTPINLQGVDWAFSFSLIEVETPDYVTLKTQMLTFKEHDATLGDDAANRKKLQEQLNLELAKLKKYKEKLVEKSEEQQIQQQ